MRILLILLVAGLAQAQTLRSLVTDSGEYGTTSFSSQSLGSLSVAFRIHGYSTQGSDRDIFSIAGSSIIKINSGTLALVGQTGGFWGDGTPDGNPQITLTGSDARVVFTRDLVNLQDRLEVWDGQCTQSSYRSSIKTITAGSTPTSSAAFRVGSGALNLAFIRLYTSALDLQQCPADAPTTPAGGFDFTFESDSLADRSAHAYTLTATGATFMDSPLYNCSVAFLDWLQPITFKTGETLTLTSSSFCARIATGVPSSFSWTRTAGPGSGSFGSASAATTTFGSSSAGTHTIQLEVGDGTANVTTTNKVGAVTVGVDGCTVTQTNADLEKILGPVVIFGNSTCSPWTYWDWLSLAEATQIAPAMLGTDDVVGNGALISSSCTVTSDPTTLTCSGAWTSGRMAGDFLVIGWDTTNRSVLQIETVDSTTQVTLASNYYTPCLRSLLICPASVSVYEPKPSVFTCAGIYSPCFNYSLWGYGAQAGNTNWNYYDLVLGLYRLGLRTGIDTYTDYAKDIADLWWTYALDSGASGGTFTRVSALAGAMARAVDGDGLTSRISDLYSLIISQTTQNNSDNTIADASSDKREMGYATGFLAIAARFDAANRAAYCTRLESMIDSWITVQDADGFYQEDLYAGNPTYPNMTNGGSPWRQMIVSKALQYSYDSLVDASVCNDTSGRPAALLASITDNLEWAYTFGRSSTNRGVFYNTNMGTQTLNAGNASGTGTVTLDSMDHTQVVGTGTNFIVAGYCDGAHYLAPWAPAPRAGSDIRLISSCADATHLTLASAWPGTAFTGVAYNVTIAALTTCGSGSAPNCENDNSGTGNVDILPEGMLSLVRLMPGSFGWLYAKTLDPIWKTRGDELFSAVYGGPASGPGYDDACAGPACDGTLTDTESALRDCASYAAPCAPGGNAFAFNATKNFPEGAGFPASDNYLSYRLQTGATQFRISNGVRFTGGITICF